MKRKQIFILVRVISMLLIICSTQYSSKAQKNKVFGSNYVTITVEVSGVDSIQFLDKPTAVIYSCGASDYINPFPDKITEVPILIVKGKFQIRLPMKSKYGYLTINLMKKLSFLNAGYPLIKQGDVINVEINQDGFNMTSSNQKLMTFQIKCYKESDFLKGLVTWKSSALSTMFARCDSIIAVNKFVSYKDHELTKLINAEYKCRFKTILYNSLKPSSITDRLFGIKVSDLLNKEKLESSMDSDYLILDNSLNYVRSIYLLNHLKISYSIAGKTGIFQNLYNTFQNLYSSTLKDRLIAYLFWNEFQNYENSSGLLITALQSTKDALSRMVISSVHNTKSVGQKAFNFELKDTTGKLVTLSDLKGKLLVFDFWFTGCGACRILSKHMNPLIEKYKNNPEITFINVCADKNEQKWKESLKSGLYSHPNETLLYTSGQGFNHPLLNYYNFKSFPSLLIVDKNGNIVSTNPPRPLDEESILMFEKLLKF